jgi:hypothetical protein
MITMFMRNDNGIQVNGFLADHFKTSYQLFAAESRINQYPGIIGLDIAGIAFTAGCQKRKTHIFTRYCLFLKNRLPRCYEECEKTNTPTLPFPNEGGSLDLRANSLN